MKETNSQKGITLLALIVTIIVLLILAVVALRAVTEDRIIEQAKSATSAYKEAEVTDEIQMMLNDAKMSKKDDGSTLESYLKNKYGNNVKVIEGGYLLLYKGYTYTINEDYTIRDVKGENDIDEIKWLYAANADGTITITGIDVSEMVGTGDYSAIYSFKLDNDTLYIPSELEYEDENGIKRIGTVTDVNINKETIYYNSPSYGAYAGIKTIIMPDTIKTWSCNYSSSYGLFKDLTNIQLSKNLTEIGEFAFDGCEKLTNIQIPDKVTSIGDWAFGSCKSLISLQIPAGVTNIGQGAFYGCEKLTSVQIPDGLTIIEDGVFNWCTGLTEIIIPERVTSIGSHAFWRCYSLTKIIIPEGVTSIEEDAFNDCTGLTDIYYGGSTFPYTGTLPDGCTVHVNSTGPTES